MTSAVIAAAALGCGLMAGFFYAFSFCVMRALGRLPPHEGIAAMQSINVAVLNRWFLGAFFGTAVLCLLAALAAPSPASLAGAALYIVGTLLVTIRFNVPRNNALARVDARGAEGASLWSTYLAEWTAWNHVRTAAAALATVALGAAGWQT